MTFFSFSKILPSIRKLDGNFLRKYNFISFFYKVYWQSVLLQTSISLFFNPCNWASTSGCHFKGISMSHQSRDSEDSTNISLNGSSLRLIRLPRHPPLQSASRLSLQAGAGHISLQLACIQKFQNPSSAKCLQEAFHRVYSLVLPYLPSVCIKDLWLPLTYSTLSTLTSSLWCDLGVMLCSHAG